MVVHLKVVTSYISCIKVVPGISFPFMPPSHSQFGAPPWSLRFGTWINLSLSLSLPLLRRRSHGRIFGDERPARRRARVPTLA